MRWHGLRARDPWRLLAHVTWASPWWHRLPALCGMGFQPVMGRSPYHTAGRLRKEPAFLLLHHQHRTGRVLHDALCRAADQGVAETGAAVRGDHDQLDVLVAGVVADR